MKILHVLHECLQILRNCFQFIGKTVSHYTPFLHYIVNDINHEKDIKQRIE